MTDSELAALADLATDGFGGAVARVEELHRAIAGRTPGGPARAAHDAVAGGVYALVRGGGRAVGGGVAAAVRAGGVGPRVLSDDPRGRLVRGALNGVWGDRLHASGSALATAMAVVPAVDAATATPFVVVLVHGLCETEAAWSLKARERGGTYATRVLAPLGATPVTVRYNTGRSIADNGRALAALLDELVATWPVAVERLVLVGHSMGGLVIRAAAAHGGAWVAAVESTVSLGTPHRGAPLARAARLAGRALALVPEGRPVGAVLDARSAGIKDLARGLPGDVLPDARHLAVAATVTADAGHPVGRLAGDLLVLTSSAHGVRARRVHVGGHDHFDLLNGPALDTLLEDWLRAGRSER
ncbi:MAG TPA: alpha/beta fold hydrolase [Baekduia sp.]|uniref:esterase/lipase family protein n=1 Tax=Baekduia sp. TaxID=2600305 RepID=UPI002D78291F|nr:alpha/beta fold hydrolase [Baekduia sp.]HET6507296.1 alpha/beta fold hydrolase [Baekduia sp.]